VNQEREEPLQNHFKSNKPSTSSMIHRNLKSNLSQISNGSTIVKKSGAFGHLNRGDSKIRLQISKSNLKRNSISIMNKTNHEKIENLI
jgi:hypothetical protein